MSFKIPESVLVVIHSPDLQVLLIERADRAGFWQSVTGSKDALEEPLALTAHRELFEETGIEAAGCVLYRDLPPDSPAPLMTLVDWTHHIEYEIYPQWRWRYAPSVSRNTEHWFSVCVPRDTAIRLAEREHVRYEWLPVQAAVDRCFSPSNGEAITRLSAYWRSPK